MVDPTLISAIVLAAGRSSRMGSSKQLLSLGGRTVLERVIATFKESNADEVVVVLGDKSGPLEGRRLRGVRVALNREASRGISSSIRAGLEAVDSGSEAVLFGLADKPFLTVATINKIIEEYRSSEKGIVVPVYRGQRGNPVLFAKEFFEELGGLSGEIGGKALIKRHRKEVLEVEVDDDGILVDIDTPSDFEKARARFDQSKSSPR